MKVKLDLIQLLRGCAAIIVVLCHINASTIFYLNTTWLSGIFAPGWVGVDFFFVLSGFIIFFAHHIDLQNRNNIKIFFKKRFIRIFPIYWAAASIYLLFLIIAGKINFSTDYVYIIKSYLLLPQANMPFLWVAWSLIFECLFYLIFGIGIYFGLKIMKYVLFSWLLLIFISQFFTLPISNLFVFNNYILEFLVGCIISYQFVYHKAKYTFNPMILIFAGIIFFLIMWFISLTTSFGGKTSLESRIVYGLASALLIFGVALYNSRKDIKVPNFLLLLGNASYSLYLIHQIVLGIAYKVSSPFLKTHENFISAFGFIVAVVAVCVGVLFHLIVEKKIIGMLNRLMLPGRNAVLT